MFNKITVIIPQHTYASYNRRFDTGKTFKKKTITQERGGRHTSPAAQETVLI